MADYLDTSALAKLVVAEPETAALRRWLAAPGRGPVTCDLAGTELLRSVRRALPARMSDARAVLDALTILTMSTSIFESAGRLEPVLLRSLDALHLAAALELGDDLDTLVTYDDRLAEAAEANGITVERPG